MLKGTEDSIYQNSFVWFPSKFECISKVIVQHVYKKYVLFLILVQILICLLKKCIYFYYFLFFNRF